MPRAMLLAVAFMSGISCKCFRASPTDTLRSMAISRLPEPGDCLPKHPARGGAAPRRKCDYFMLGNRSGGMARSLKRRAGPTRLQSISELEADAEGGLEGVQRIVEAI